VQQRAYWRGEVFPCCTVKGQKGRGALQLHDAGFEDLKTARKTQKYSPGGEARKWWGVNNNSFF